MRPLLRCLARPMKEEWKIRPYFGVLPFVFRALQQKASCRRIIQVVSQCLCHCKYGGRI